MNPREARLPVIRTFSTSVPFSEDSKEKKQLLCEQVNGNMQHCIKMAASELS